MGIAMRKILLVIFCLLISKITFGAPVSQYTVGIKEAIPFAYKENGQWTGFSVEILNHLSRINNFSVNFVEFDNITTLIESTKQNKVDFSIAAISINAEREQLVDLSHSYFNTGIGVLINTDSSMFSTIGWIGTKIIIVLVAFIFILYGVGIIVDKVDGDMNIKGAHDGAWWAIVTFSTTGYGDKVPTTNNGKLLAAIWITISMFLLSVFTSYLSSAWTVKRLDDKKITLSDLYNIKTTTITGSTSQLKLHELGIPYSTTDTLQQAIDLLAKHKTKAIVYDKSMLDFIAKNNQQYAVWEIEANSEKYAIAFPTNSPLLESFNVSILKERDSTAWSSIKMKYFN